jgi:hypothetical protein
MTPRRRWRGQREPVRYCSERCRRTPLGSVDHALERAILELLDNRAAGDSICPSEAARRLVTRGAVVIIQQGCVVDPSTARGPVRLRRPRAGETPSP